MAYAMADLGWKFYFINAAWNFVFLVVAYFTFVETKGLKLEEINAKFEERESLRGSLMIPTPRKVLRSQRWAVWLLKRRSHLLESIVNIHLDRESGSISHQSRPPILTSVPQKLLFFSEPTCDTRNLGTDF